MFAMYYHMNGLRIKILSDFQRPRVQLYMELQNYCVFNIKVLQVMV